MHMPHVVSILQIDPGKIGSIGPDVSCGMVDHSLVNFVHEISFSIVGKRNGIVFETVEMVIEPDVSCGSQTFADEFRTIVEP